MVMLCSQIQLVERQQSVPHRESSGIVQRLCAIQNVSNITSTTTAVVVKHDEDDVSESARFEDRPRSRVRSCRPVKSELHLQVSSLRMQPGTKTLAPIDIKRDPRKLPSFCQHYKQIKRLRSIDNADLDLMIRGTEISQDPILHDPSLTVTENHHEEENVKLNIELTECCHCSDNKGHVLDRLNIEQILRDECQVKIYDNLDEERTRANVVGPVKPIEEPSPRTLQVISVKLHSRKLDDADLST